MILLNDLKDKYKDDLVIKNQLEMAFNDYSDLEIEFDNFWETHKEEVINDSSMGNGHIAGAGAIDYNESKVLYFYIRIKKPKNILEIGHASGCSTVVLAKAIEMNNMGGNVYTCDIKGNAVEKPHKNFIPSFSKYMDNGIVKATSYVDAIKYTEDLDVEIDFVFVDASHEPEFCIPMARLLRDKYPEAFITYHEWSFADATCNEAKEYISLKENIKHQAMAERASFEKAFDISEYSHFGFYGSCGLGVVEKRKDDQTIKVYYRLSNKQAGIHKDKIANANKKLCLENCINKFGKENVTVIGDNLNREHTEWLRDLGVRLVEVSNGNGSGTFRDALNLAVKENFESDFVYLLEDDFLHKAESKGLLIEGLNKYDSYITLYDHPDKYLNKEEGGNPFIEDGGEVTRVVTSKSTHWKITNSTVMSFACRVSRLKHDMENLLKYSSNNITDSFGLFIELRNEKGIEVLSSIPGYSTHCEKAWLSPFTTWENIND